MRYLRLIVLAAGMLALGVLFAPASALAGTYSWSLPGEFTATGGGHNPEQKFGQPSWAYYSGSASTGLTPLPTFDPTLPGWTDSNGDSVSVSGSNLVLNAAGQGAVTVGFRDPFPPSQPATVTYSAGSFVCLGGSLALTDQSGNPINSGSQITGPVYLTFTGGVLLSCSVNVSQFHVQATTPGLTLTSPTGGEKFTGGQPQFSGTASAAFDASNVTLRVYSGSSASGTPVETLSATPTTGGSYSAAPTTPLVNGTYTVQATQEDPVGSPNAGSPATATFTVANVGLTLSLNSLGFKPLLTATPILTGHAGTRPQDSKNIVAVIFSGAKATGLPIRVMNGSPGANGDYSVPVTPPLDDGQYTAVVGQATGSSFGLSNPVTFRVKVHPPSLTLIHPAAGASVSRSDVFFDGQAGTELGDSGSVVLYLYRGEKARGKLLGKRRIGVHGSTWSGAWGRQLKNGLYTVRAVQTDDAGHRTRITHTFLIVPAPTTIGSSVALSPSGTVSVPITCLGNRGVFCNGSVLIVTAGSYRTMSGGPSGPLEVLFSYVQIPGGQTLFVRGHVPKPALDVLRRLKRTTVRVTTALKIAGGSSRTVSARRTLRLK